MSVCSARLLLLVFCLWAVVPALAQTKKAPPRPAARPTGKAQAAKPAVAPPAPLLTPVKPAVPPPDAPTLPPRTDPDKPYDYVEQMPEFPGGSGGIIRFLAENVKYPPRALRYQITGKVYCKFVVDTLGRVRQPVISRSLTPDCDSEVIRVIRLLPAFKPGRQGGRPVAVYFNVPVSFSIPDGRPAGWQPPPRFAQLLARAGMEFRYPAGMIETPVIPNPQQAYDFALRHPTKRFEVRYAIRPLDSLVLAYRAAGSQLTNPNDTHLKDFVFGVLPNISGGESGEPKEFPLEPLRYEFAADWAALSVVPLDRAFGQKYQYCSAVAMHKADRADVYMFFLFDKEEDMQALMDPSFHALRFQR